MEREQDVHERLAEHLSQLGMGYPGSEVLVEILKEYFTPLEARVALAIPSRVIPLRCVGTDEILDRIDLSREELVSILEGLAERGLIFSGEMGDGERGYALQQVGYGFPQVFFWKGEDTPSARKMAGFAARYFNREVTRKGYSAEPKPYRYVPVGRSLEAGIQAVLPHHSMEGILEKAEVIAVGHCPCRVVYRLRGGACGHPTEVCLKFNDMARYVIERGIAREVTREEALDIILMAEKAGLVHFVDNAEGDIQHNCNCCGCACWNVGNIRRRKIPRDVLMATYFIRETTLEDCTGCGACVDVCPVEAVKMEGDLPVVDQEWCIGCGVCVSGCPSGAATLQIRPDRTGKLPAGDFEELHKMIIEGKGLDGKGD